MIASGMDEANTLWNATRNPGVQSPGRLGVVAELPIRGEAEDESISHSEPWDLH